MQQKRIVSLAGALVILMSAVGLLTSCLGSNDVLEGNVFEQDTDFYGYFSGGVVYSVRKNNSTWIKVQQGTYKGKTVNIQGRKFEVVVKGDGIELSGLHLKRVTDQALITKIKNLPVTKR